MKSVTDATWKPSQLLPPIIPTDEQKEAEEALAAKLLGPPLECDDFDEAAAQPEAPYHAEGQPASSATTASEPSSHAAAPQRREVRAAAGTARAGDGGGSGSPPHQQCSHPLHKGPWERYFSLYAHLRTPCHRAPLHSLLCGYTLDKEHTYDMRGAFSQYQVLAVRLLVMMKHGNGTDTHLHRPHVVGG